MKKGFTLAELMGVIVIIGIIAVVVSTSIGNNIAKSRVSTCKAQEKNIIESAKVYLTDNPSLLPTTTSEDSPGLREISIRDELMSGGYVDENIKNPMTDDIYYNTSKVMVISCKKKVNSGDDKSSYRYKYKVCYSTNKEGCSQTEEDTCSYVENQLKAVCGDSE